jgi:hypothetical protein
MKNDNYFAAGSVRMNLLTGSAKATDHSIEKEV